MIFCCLLANYPQLIHCNSERRFTGIDFSKTVLVVLVRAILNGKRHCLTVTVSKQLEILNFDGSSESFSHSFIILESLGESKNSRISFACHREYIRLDRLLQIEPFPRNCLLDKLVTAAIRAASLADFESK